MIYRYIISVYVYDTCVAQEVGCEGGNGKAVFFSCISAYVACPRHIHMKRYDIHLYVYARRGHLYCTYIDAKALRYVFN